MRSRKIFSVLILCLITLALANGEALADAYHYKNILVGERASGMGGAYTAVSDDTSGLYYNPAGIVYSPGSNLSGSANAVHFSRKEYKDVFGGKGWERKASTFLPNFFGVVQDFGPGRKVGLSYVVPDAIIEDQDQTFFNIPAAIDTTGDGVLDTSTNVTRYVINFNNDDQTYNFGPSYAAEVSDTLSLGVSLYFHHRRDQWILNQYITYDTSDYEWVNTYYETREWGIKPVIGLIWTPADKYSVGLSASMINVYESETRLESTRKPTYSDNTLHIVVEDSGNRKYPTNVNLGLAYFPSPSSLYSFDLSYHGPADDDFYGEREAVWNAAIGGEFYYNQAVAFRAGLFTNYTSAPELKDDEVNSTSEHVDLIGASASLSYFTRGASLTLGGTYSQGKGEAQVVEGSTELQDMEMEMYTLFISTSYNY